MSLPRIKEYTILSATTHLALRTAVNTQIAEGWEPVGGVCVDFGDYYHQAMILRETSEHNKDGE